MCCSVALKRRSRVAFEFFVGLLQLFSIAPLLKKVREERGRGGSGGYLRGRLIEIRD